MKFTFYIMNKKGFSTLARFCDIIGVDKVASVVCSKDQNVQNDYYDEIKKFCDHRRLQFYDRNDGIKFEGEYSFAIGWRWLIATKSNLIVTHDSLLPRYRGFAPLVNCLINGETTIGVTALKASAEYDQGDIVGQESISIDYPIKISEAIDRVIPIFGNLVIGIAKQLLEYKELRFVAQDESKATYSLWRDDEDYHINWNRDALEVQRFVDAVGCPYRGAFSWVNGEKIRIYGVEIVQDVFVENRMPGKVIFKEGHYPVVVCKSGLIKIIDAKLGNSDCDALPHLKFRTRFQ